MTPTRKKEIEQLTMRILSAYQITENPGKHLKKNHTRRKNHPHRLP